MTVDIDKLKAPALAATQGQRRWWACRDGDHDYVQIAAGPERIAQIRISTLTEADLNLLIATDPATVLELIAEDERKANRIAELEAEVEQVRAAKRPKDHNIRQLVNDLRNIAEMFGGTQQLRARISGAVGQFIDDSYSAAAGAAAGGGTSEESGKPS